MVTRDTRWPAGTPCWVDVSVDDVPKAVAFYEGLFGWDIQVGGPEVGGYAIAHKDGQIVAEPMDVMEEGRMAIAMDTAGAAFGIWPGIGEYPAETPAEVPAAWGAYFMVEDTDAAMAKAVELGGSVVRPAADSPYGRMGTVTDDHGAVFSVMTPPAG